MNVFSLSICLFLISSCLFWDKCLRKKELFFLSRSNDRLLGSEVAGVLLMLMTVQTV